jgi:hypothetical protein
MHVILNIGLNQSSNFIYKALVYNEVTAIIENALSRHGVIVKCELKTVTHAQGIEDTLIVLLKLKHHTEYRVECFESDIKNLSTLLCQDCISICYLNGKLLGLYADNWGQFNLDYFHFNA